jgi:membrane associated rhomboid family serine protease
LIPIRDTIPSRNPAVTVIALIIANAFAFFLELTMSEAQLQRFFYLFGLVPARYTHPYWAAYVGFPIDSYWPFLTSMFLHGGWLHIIGNMWTLWIFGDNVEDRMGPLRFLIFYFLCGIAAGLVHSITNPDSIVPSVGASGAIAGVLGAYFIMYPKARIIALFPILFIPLFIELSAFAYLGIWILTQVFSGTFALSQPGSVGGIAWWAHIGGFVTGMLLHPLFIRRTDRKLQSDEWSIEAAWHPYVNRNRWS